jgi:hypothetical protein
MTETSAPEVHVAPGRYRHFKGSEYQVLSVARHSETDEVFVVYRALSDPDRLWIRPAEMFVEDVAVPGGFTPRFSARAASRFRERVATVLIELSNSLWRGSTSAVEPGTTALTVGRRHQG